MEINMISAQELERIRVNRFSISTSLLMNAAREKGLTCELLPERAFCISNGKTSQYFKGNRLPCNNMVVADLASNKYFLRKMLQRSGIPVPKTMSLTRPSDWKKVAKSSLHFPLVVKPLSASNGSGSSMNIGTPDELRLAVQRAFSYIHKNKVNGKLLVEEYFTGSDLRFFVIGDAVVSVLRTEPAYVIGDGIHTIRALIAAFNKEWRSAIKYEMPLCPIPIDMETVRYLRCQKKTLNFIPKKDEKTILRWIANVSTGGRATNVTEDVHPNLKQLAVQVAHIAKLEITGIDILCKDITSGDVSGANVSVLETNAAPGIDIHHFPFVGKGENISAMILDHIFS